MSNHDFDPNDPRNPPDAEFHTSWLQSARDFLFPQAELRKRLAAANKSLDFANRRIDYLLDLREDVTVERDKTTAANVRLWQENEQLKGEIRGLERRAALGRDPMHDAPVPPPRHPRLRHEEINDECNRVNGACVSCNEVRACASALRGIDVDVFGLDLADGVDEVGEECSRVGGSCGYCEKTQECSDEMEKGRA